MAIASQTAGVGPSSGRSAGAARTASKARAFPRGREVVWQGPPALLPSRGAATTRRSVAQRAQGALGA